MFLLWNKSKRFVHEKMHFVHGFFFGQQNVVLFVHREVKRVEKKSGRYSVAGNCLWIFRQQFRLAPGSFWMMALPVPLNIIIKYWQVYLPAFVVTMAVDNSSFAQVAGRLTVYSLGILAVALANNVMTRCVEGEKNLFRGKVESLLHRSSVTTFYQIFEKKEVRELYQRAHETTEMWDGMQPLTDLPKKSLLLVQDILCYILFGGMIAGVSPWLLLPVMAGPALHLIFTRRYNRWHQKMREQSADPRQKLEYVMMKSGDFTAAKDIRIYSMADWFVHTFHTLRKELDAWELRAADRRFHADFVAVCCNLLRDGAAYAVLIAMALRGALSVEQFVLCFGAVGSFAAAFGSILKGLGELHGVSLKICDLREYMELPEAEDTGTASIEEHLRTAPEFTFENVSFRYENAAEDTLRGLSFTLRAGESVALVGLNGSGKTTLVKLLCGLYRPSQGRILLNGIPIESFPRREYYRLIAPVFQDSRTAFFSLAEMTAGQIGSGFDEARAEVCMRAAGLGDKIDSLPQGIHTRTDRQMTEEGIELSGGEMQKLMLARVLYKDAPVLVLDEPTAALDPLAENAVYQQYRDMTRGKTSLFISHRLASTRFCDRIFYLENGRITEEGSHEKLVEKGGEYARLFELQSCWYREDYRKDGENE